MKIFWHVWNLLLRRSIEAPGSLFEAPAGQKSLPAHVTPLADIFSRKHPCLSVWLAWSILPMPKSGSIKAYTNL
jgi:hypothetical protein